MHIEKLLTVNESSYRELSIEFLSSLELERDELTNRPVKLTFQLLGEPRSITWRQLNTLFGFNSNGLPGPLPGFNKKDAWQLLSADLEPYQTRKSKDS
ncbi:MAG: hypothetical protein Q8807_03665, partial ['Waltheria sp.' little leaf phytoplasma]|nr:hypothetical protein ['Waltheria sp.' little leaf phytoplasma]